MDSYDRDRSSIRSATSSFSVRLPDMTSNFTSIPGWEYDTVAAWHLLSTMGRAGTPPASWLLDGATSAPSSWTLAASVYIWLRYSRRFGVLCFYWRAGGWNVETRSSPPSCLAINPYHLVIVYWRSAFAELLAACLLPLLLLFILKAAEDEQQMIVPLGSRARGGMADRTLPQR